MHLNRSADTMVSVLSRHRGDRVMQAYVIVSMSRHGVVANTELATLLNLSPHGLRAMLEPSGLFVIELLPDAKWGRLCPWYRIDRTKTLETQAPPAGLLTCNSVEVAAQSKDETSGRHGQGV